MDYLIFISMGLILLAGIFEGINKIWPKNIFVWFVISSLTISFVFQIIVFKYNKRAEKDKEDKANQKFNTLSIKYDSATKIIIKQGDTIRLKEDGIRTFIETYLLKDSVMRAKYDSINRGDREKGHPELEIFHPKLYKMGDLYFTGYRIENKGQRTAIDINLKEYVVTSVWGIYEKCGSVTLPTSSPLPADEELEIYSFNKLKLILYNFNYPTYFYIEGTYGDIDFISKKYPFSELFATTPKSYNKDSSGLTICRPWEKIKIQSFLKKEY